VDLDTFLAELAAWAEERDPGFEPVVYGDHPDQVADVRRGGARNAIVVHGGFWRPAFTRANTRAVAVELARTGWTTWNVEYRRTGLADTLADVSAVLDVTGPGVAIATGRRTPRRAAGTGKSQGGAAARAISARTREASLRRGRRVAGSDPPAHASDAPPAAHHPCPAGARDRG
jgi:acetyl esterase/lipase